VRVLKRHGVGDGESELRADFIGLYLPRALCPVILAGGLVSILLWGKLGIYIFPQALANCHNRQAQLPHLRGSQSRMQVHPIMHHQGCRYCSLASEEVAYNTSYCSAELQRSRPRQRLHSTNSPE
jgi:hypothetical protein